MQKIALLFMLLFGITACFDAPKYSDVPRITEVQLLADTSIVRPGDEVFLNILFEDGDGDIGLADGDTVGNNVFLFDFKLNLMDSVTYYIPYIPSKGSVSDISGNVMIGLESSNPDNNTGRISSYCLPGLCAGRIDTVFFDIRIKDRSGNFSNMVTSPKIIIDCR